ncbi:hypothetical protein HZS_3533 [Henneguya salminicola]|nr:hypothetical protein HZS_3533 [Henneguya salminicola]
MQETLVMFSSDQESNYANQNKKHGKQHTNPVRSVFFQQKNLMIAKNSSEFESTINCMNHFSINNIIYIKRALPATSSLPHLITMKSFLFQ